ncbi:Lipase 3 [Melipona quadrifasciata]|uniref:Lipase 3 n=1 Tax=Melipona quadrifasciata TaxID=166423 RepID=A0A0N0U502_9HYME|nr:Lipase 3 [Melipona quadrifasciata]
MLHPHDGCLAQTQTFQIHIALSIKQQTVISPSTTVGSCPIAICTYRPEECADVLEEDLIGPFTIDANDHVKSLAVPTDSQGGLALAVSINIVNASIPFPRRKYGTAVLLLHGILDASPTWLVAGPERALGFILADQGYDVWLGNMRGNRYSRKHLTLTVSDPDFWNLNWNEMGIYDVPAMIDHIIEQTKQEKIFMVSHSQGNFRKFDYGLSGNIEIYNDINPPDYNLGNILLPVYLHYATNDTIADVQDVLELYEVLPNAQKLLVQYDLFAHLDFVWGEDANTLVYNEVLSLMGAMEINY